MAYSVLVGPSVEETTTLSESEYKTLKCALELARSEDKEAEAIASALQDCTEDCVKSKGVFRGFFRSLMLDFGEHIDEIQGMLVEHFEQPIFLREDEGAEHVTALKAFLKILEAKGWLANFFWPVRIERYAEKSPTPLEVMQDLTESAVMFECDINDAKKMIREWPELFPGQRAAELQEVK
jgi:hypothetical protein